MHRSSICIRDLPAVQTKRHKNTFTTSFQGLPSKTLVRHWKYVCVFICYATFPVAGLIAGYTFARLSVCLLVLCWLLTWHIWSHVKVKRLPGWMQCWDCREGCISFWPLGPHCCLICVCVKLDQNDFQLSLCSATFFYCCIVVDRWFLFVFLMS